MTVHIRLPFCDISEMVPQRAATPFVQQVSNELWVGLYNPSESI